MELPAAIALLSFSAPITVAIIKLVNRNPGKELTELAVAVARLETKVEGLKETMVSFGEMMTAR